MKAVVWLVLLFAVAVVAATALGGNDGLASFYWAGWRIDVSLNLFILGLLASFIALASSVRLTRWLLGLPARARAWRAQRREAALQAAQRQALLEMFAARYSRVVKACRKAQELLEGLEPRQDGVLAQATLHLLAAAALHRLQDRAGRDEQAQRAQACLQSVRRPGPADSAAIGLSSAAEGLLLLQAEWSLEDRDAAAALEQLSRLPRGAGRRIQAQRLRLQAHQLAQQPADALKAVRQLAKHQAFKPEVARSLSRSLALAVLDGARDIEGLQRTWLTLEREERQDIGVISHAVRRAVDLGQGAWARRIIRPLWEASSSLDATDRGLLSACLWQASGGIEADWLGPVEAVLARHPREPMVQAAAGAVYAERQLWGKAQPLLEQAVRAGIPSTLRRQAWRRLAQMAEQRGDEVASSRCWRQAAEVD